MHFAFMDKINGASLAGIGKNLGAFGRGVGNGMTFGQMDTAIALVETHLQHNGKTYAQNLHGEHLKTARGGNVSRAGVETGTILVTGVLTIGEAVVAPEAAPVLIATAGGTILASEYMNERGWEDAGSSLVPAATPPHKTGKAAGKQ